MPQQITIYIGLNDSETNLQKFETGKYLSILKNRYRSYQTPFSVQLINGGYFHDDGVYTEENTLMLTLMDVSEQFVQSISEDLCAFFNQESVMSCLHRLSVIFIKEKL